MSDENKIDLAIFQIIKNVMDQSGNLEDMAESLVQLLTGALEMKGCTLFVSNPDSKELEIMTSFGLSLKYLEKGNISSEKSLTTIYNQKRPVVVQDTSEDTDLLQYPEDAQKEGIKAIVSLPIVFSGRVIGAIRVYSDKPWDISEHDLETLLLFADYTGMAMMYSRLLNAFEIIKDAVTDVHDIWLKHF